MGRSSGPVWFGSYRCSFFYRCIHFVANFTQKKKCVCICGRVSMYARRMAKHHRIMQEVKTAAEYRSGIFIKCLITDGTVLKCEHLNSSCHNSNSYSRNTGPFCTDMKDTHFWRILLKKKKKLLCDLSKAAYCHICNRIHNGNGKAFNLHKMSA